MRNIDRNWETYERMLRWFEAKYNKGEIDDHTYLVHVKKITRSMQEMIIYSKESFDLLT